jgi:splicing factor 3B subunit 3
MHLLALTLQKPTAINIAIYGNFTAPKAQEIAVSRGRILELLRPDDNGKLQSIYSVEVFGIIRSMLPFRLTGGTRDYIVLGSDSGRVTILEWSDKTNSFERVHLETYGKTGCRRITPGQYLALDPKGRAIMIGAVEKQKLVYVMNRDASSRLTISSPLEAHKNNTIAFDIVGIDVGFENPVFAVIEMDYSDADQDSTGEAALETEKMLTFYELDLGLNHVIRKWSEPINRTANMILSVPGGSDGPGGVLICSEGWVSYRNQGHDEVRAPIPRREDMTGDRGLLIIASATHRQKNFFFFLVQSELGDIYKVSLEINPEGDRVADVCIKYFDTVPVANSLCITKTGLLFVASEFCNHCLYQFQGIGEDDDSVETKSVSMEVEESAVDIPTFRPRELTNLTLVDQMDSLAPITDMKVADLTTEETPQVYTLCGRGPRSSLRVLRHGLAVTVMAVSELPGNPNAVWTVKRAHSDPYDRYIVVSFNNASLVLSIGDTVEEVTDSGFLATAPTLEVVLLDDDGLLQVHANGIRHVRADRRINEWQTPGRKVVEKAAANARQVVIALAGGELIS